MNMITSLTSTSWSEINRAITAKSTTFIALNPAHMTNHYTAKLIQWIILQRVVLTVTSKVSEYPVSIAGNINPFYEGQWELVKLIIYSIHVVVGSPLPSLPQFMEWTMLLWSGVAYKYIYAAHQSSSPRTCTQTPTIQSPRVNFIYYNKTRPQSEP